MNALYYISHPESGGSRRIRTNKVTSAANTTAANPNTARPEVLKGLVLHRRFPAGGNALLPSLLLLLLAADNLRLSPPPDCVCDG